MFLLLRWLANALTLILVAYLVPGFEVSGFYAALVTALALGLVNAIIRPVILFFTLPINILTLGLFTLVVNAFLIWLVSTFIEGFEVIGFMPALIGAVILWFVSLITNFILKK